MKSLGVSLLAFASFHGVAQHTPRPAEVEAKVRAVMASTGSRGLAIAVIENGRVNYVRAYGVRNDKGDPLTIDTVMYGASLTKTVVAYTSLQLVDQHRLDLDQPLQADLDKPLLAYGPDPVFLTKYGPYKDLASDDRWKTITPRMCLTHSTGFANFAYLEPDHKLRIHFDPGTHYSYSGEGFILLQFIIEHGRISQRLGVDLGSLTQGICRTLRNPVGLLWLHPSFYKLAPERSSFRSPQCILPKNLSTR